MNLTLKIKILEKHRYQGDFARTVGISEDRLSRIIHSRITASNKEKRKIAKELGAKVKEIFPDGGAR